jgi:hypothetical protein
MINCLLKYYNDIAGVQVNDFRIIYDFCLLLYFFGLNATTGAVQYVDTPPPPYYTLMNPDTLNNNSYDTQTTTNSNPPPPPPPPPLSMSSSPAYQSL